jgi:hypothetical protein
MILAEQYSPWIAQTQTIFWSAWTLKTEASAKCHYLFASRNGVITHINTAAATSELAFQALFH